MKTDEDSGGMWCLVMFDLPVQTKKQRHSAVEFRNMLLDMGYGMVQYSVYVRYTPTQAGNRATVKAIKDNLPAQGSIRILHIATINGHRRCGFPTSNRNTRVKPQRSLRFFECEISIKRRNIAPLERLYSLSRGEDANSQHDLELGVVVGQLIKRGDANSQPYWRQFMVSQQLIKRGGC